MPQSGREYLQNIHPMKDMSLELYKECLQLNNKRTSNPIFKMSKDLDRYFTKDGIQMSNKHVKRYST